MQVDGRSIVRTNSSEMVRELCLSGAGIALRSLWDVSDALAAGHVRQILADHQGSADVGLFALWLPQDNLPRTMRVFIDFLAGLYAPLPPWERSAIALAEPSL